MVKRTRLDHAGQHVQLREQSSADPVRGGRAPALRFQRVAHSGVGGADVGRVTETLCLDEAAAGGVAVRVRGLQDRFRPVPMAQQHRLPGTPDDLLRIADNAVGCGRRGRGSAGAPISELHGASIWAPADVRAPPSRAATGRRAPRTRPGRWSTRPHQVRTALVGWMYETSALAPVAVGGAAHGNAVDAGGPPPGNGPWPPRKAVVTDSTSRNGRVQRSGFRDRRMVETSSELGRLRKRVLHHQYAPIPAQMAEHRLRMPPGGGCPAPAGRERGPRAPGVMMPGARCGPGGIAMPVPPRAACYGECRPPSPAVLVTGRISPVPRRVRRTLERGADAPSDSRAVSAASTSPSRRASAIG
jgi:hypothetical protein